MEREARNPGFVPVATPAPLPGALEALTSRGPRPSSTLPCCRRSDRVRPGRLRRIRQGSARSQRGLAELRGAARGCDKWKARGCKAIGAACCAKRQRSAATCRIPSLRLLGPALDRSDLGNPGQPVHRPDLPRRRRQTVRLRATRRSRRRSHHAHARTKASRRPDRIVAVHALMPRSSRASPARAQCARRKDRECRQRRTGLAAALRAMADAGPRRSACDAVANRPAQAAAAPDRRAAHDMAPTPTPSPTIPPIISRIRAANASTANGLVIISMPGARNPLASAAFSE